MTADLLLVIDHRETQLTLDGRALRVATPGVAPRHIPLGLLGLVVVHGRALVGCDVWRALAERHIPAVLQPGRGTGASAGMGAALGSTVALRTAQHRAADRPDLTHTIARRLVAAKITAQGRVAEHLAVPESAVGPRQRLLAHQDEALAHLATASTNSELMGIEGAAAVAWFQWLGTWLPPAWNFHGRNRRPPRDPVNALLSLGYTLLGGDMLAVVQQQGLDPARGFLHSLVPGRESLVLDLIEPLRPLVDLVVLGLLDKVLTPADFTLSHEDGCRLTKDGRARFYQAWARARQDWPLLPSETAGAGETERSKVSLHQVCRQQIDLLRRDLQPMLPPLMAVDTGG